jgi:PAS domain S-box-containing protein
MDAQLEHPVEEIKRLRRCINDLVGVLAMPATWIGGRPDQIVRSLLDVLPGMLQLDLVYVRLADPAGGVPIEMARVAQPQSPAIGPQEIGKLLDQYLGDDPHQWPPSSRNRMGDDDMSFVPLSLGLQGDVGMIVAGCRRPDFPGQTERLLLGVAANQAAIGLQEAWLLSEQRRVTGELDQRVAQRTSELATANEELKKEIAERRLVEERLRREEAELRHSEARKTAILDSALDCFVTIDHESRITEFNPAAERTFGFSRSEVMGRHLADVMIPPAFREAHRRGFARYLATGEARVLGRRLEMTAVRADGSEFPVELAITRIPFDGSPSFTGYLRDITERKQSEEKLRRSEAYLAEAQKLSHAGSFGWKIPSGELTWSDETFRIFGIESTAKPTLELVRKRVHPEDVPVVNQVIERAAQDGRDFDHEHRLLMPDGSVKHVRVVAHAERAASGELQFVGAVMDITVAKETEAYLRASAKIAQSLMAVRAEVGAALSRPIPVKEMLQECAQAMVRHLEAAFARIWTLNHGEDMLELQASAGAYMRLDGTHSRIKVGSLKVGLIAREQKPFLTNDVLNDPRIGDKEWARSCGFVSFAGHPLVVDGRTIGVIGMFARHPLSDAVIEALASVADTIAQGCQRKRNEDELRRTEAYLSEGQRLSHTGSWAWNVKTREYLFWSREHYCIYGFDPEADTGRYAVARERIHPDDAGALDETLDRAIQARSDFETHHRIILPGGEVKHLHVLGHPAFGDSGDVVEYIGTVMDVTERLRSEEALRKAQANLSHMARLTTVGELTASIAHEVNQPLAAVVTNANACLRWLDHEPPNFEEVRIAIQRIVRDGNHGGDVIKRIRGLVKKEHPHRARLDVNEVVQETIALAGVDLQGTALRTELADDLPPAQADRVQLQQVLLNLTINAMDAMKAVTDRPHVLRIRTKRHEAGSILVAVQDSGVGLNPERMERLFETFYTTKPEGLGMGLSICRSIIDRHGGRLWAESTEGSGATFQFTLPIESKGAL